MKNIQCKLKVNSCRMNKQCGVVLSRNSIYNEKWSVTHGWHKNEQMTLPPLHPPFPTHSSPLLPHPTFLIPSPHLFFSSWFFFFCSCRESSQVLYPCPLLLTLEISPQDASDLGPGRPGWEGLSHRKDQRRLPPCTHSRRYHATSADPKILTCQIRDLTKELISP